MEWKNFGYDIYKEIMGEEEFKKRLKDAHTIPPKGMFDDLSYFYKKEKLKFLLGAASLVTGQRPVHPEGIGASGIATIVPDPQIPRCEFFTPGQSYPVCLRHSTTVSDHAELTNVSASIAFADNGVKSPQDFILGGGRCLFTWNLQGVIDLLVSLKSHDYKTYYLKNPDYLACHIECLRRTPDSFYDQRYNSGVIYDFKAFDGVKRYVKFRLMPADGRPETGLLTEEDQRNVWDHSRLPSETREKDYLNQEFKERLSRAPVKYKLQLALHEARSDDPPETLNIARIWDEATHPWLDLADIILTTLLSPNATEQLGFNNGTLSSCLELLPFTSQYHSNCLAPLRVEVYERSRKCRVVKGVNREGDHVITYIISVETGSQARAGTDANISVSLTGTKAKTEKINLSSWRNDFEAGRKDNYTVQAMDVGEVLLVHVYKGESGWWRNSNLFVNKISVKSSTQDKTFEFPCYRWVVSHITVFQGKALLPFQDQPEAIRAQRVLELQDRKEQYLWKPNSGLGLPGYIEARKHDDLPLDSQFSDAASHSFDQGQSTGVLSYLYSYFESWDNFDDFKQIISGREGKLPKVFEDDLWMEDKEFGFQFLNGCNPCVIERCNKLPSNFPVTEEMVKNFLDRGLTFMEEIKAGHIYIVDYKELDGIKRKGEDSDSQWYTAAPLCLFYVKSCGDLVPIAIQLFQQPSDTNPIWTPDDSKYDWMLAKMWLRNADHQIHQMGTRLMSTHLVMEAFAVASWRQLPSIHPVFQLLLPHLRPVMATNTNVRNELIAEGGIADNTLSIGGGGHIQLLEKTYKKFKFEMLTLPDVLKKRGVLDTKKLPNYYYRDDALRMWNAISDFIREVMQVFYQKDDDLSKDRELQSWVMDIHENGFPLRDGEIDHEFPTSLHTREQLVHVLTCVVFTCSCQHAAVNFSQRELAAFIPNSPPLMRLPPPTRRNEATMKSIMDTLPNKSQAEAHVAAIYSFTRKVDGQRFLGDYSQSLLTGEAVQDAISRFQASLQKISDEIKQRNSNVKFPYECLLPERVPNSIAF